MLKKRRMISVRKRGLYNNNIVVVIILRELEEEKGFEKKGMLIH
jgi:hypothetical protein